MTDSIETSKFLDSRITFGFMKIIGNAPGKPAVVAFAQRAECIIASTVLLRGATSSSKPIALSFAMRMRD